jgi:hypothetical protein
MLRISITESKCGELYNEFDLSNPKDKETFEDCSQWLGPNLPGITTPDFTEGSAAAARTASREAPAREIGERRSAGQPDAGPVAGQRDISKPQITLPPDLQRLVEGLTPRERRDLPRDIRRRLEDVVGPLPQTPQPPPAPVPAPAPAPAPPSPTGPPLLDYLLAP